MNDLRTTRIALSVGGALTGLYGVVRLLGHGWADLLATLAWLAGVVLAHDAVLAPAVVVVGYAASRLLPPWSRRAALVVLVVLGPPTLVAVPVLGRFGARADNPTLLDRPYAAGWLALAALVLAVAAVLAVRDRRREAFRG